MNNYRSPYNSPVIRPRQARRHHFGVWLMCLVFFIFLAMHYALPVARHVSATSMAAARLSSEKSARQTAMSALPDRLQAITTQDIGAIFSVSMIDLNSGATQHIGSTESFDAASTGKLITATDMLHEIENGNYTLDQDLEGDTIQDWLQALIVNSDETAWEVLNDELTHSQMSDYASSIGVASFDPDQNTITSDDMALLLQKLYNHDLLNHTNTDLLLSYMKQANYRQYIVAGAPSAATVYHKVGWNDNVVNDAAIITDGSHNFVLVIDSSGPTDSSVDPDEDAARITALQSITKTVSAAYTMPE